MGPTERCPKCGNLYFKCWCNVGTGSSSGGGSTQTSSGGSTGTQTTSGSGSK